MMPEGGSLLTLTYYGAERVMPHYNVMGVAKAALEASVRYLAEDVGKDGIRVNAILPGPFITNIAGGRLRNKADRAAFESQSLIGRIGDVDDIKGLALLLASPAGAFFTGSLIVIDGGALTRMT